eukprot:15464500-Alexandrium_andersonii.AAC.2
MPWPAGCGHRLHPQCFEALTAAARPLPPVCPMRRLPAPAEDDPGASAPVPPVAAAPPPPVGVPAPGAVGAPPSPRMPAVGGDDVGAAPPSPRMPVVGGGGAAPMDDEESADES